MHLKLAKAHPHVAEVGVGDAFCSKSLPFWEDPAGRVTLVEPNPFLYASLLGKIAYLPHVRLHHVAVADRNQLGWLVSAGVLSYLPEVESPINTIFRGKLTDMLAPMKVPVNLVTFDQIDDGTIDLLILGMEGAESMVFPSLVSRPAAIILNNHFANDYRYTFPRFEVIQQWCADNGYHIAQGIPDLLLINVGAYKAGQVQVYQPSTP